MLGAPFDHLDGASIHFGLIVRDLLYDWVFRLLRAYD